MYRIAFSLILAIAASGCGNSESGAPQNERENARGEAAEEGTARPSASEKLRGSWDFEVSSFIDTAPPDRRIPLRVLYLTFRREEVREAEFRRYKLGAKQRASILGSRRKLEVNPAHPELLKAKEAYVAFLKAIPHLEITETTFGYVNPNKRESNPYKVLKQSADQVLIEVSHAAEADAGDGEVEQLECAFRGEDRLLITEVGKSTSLRFRRMQQRR